ncbi:MAG: DUF427 domain-containing protein [Spirochaeta sp.]|nr:DUF427 domain-containing protein [Spirochaeta sp.]
MNTRVQESVWDYPRPPRIDPSKETVEVWFGGIQVALSTATLRVLETSHPPVYYFPPEDIREDLLKAISGSSNCEWKGAASYFNLVVGGKSAQRAVWTYRGPGSAFMPIAGYYAFYPSKMERCIVDGYEVQPQEGDFYGGWITPNIQGPFKGGHGTWGW